MESKENSSVKINRSKIINDHYKGSGGVYHGFSFMPGNEAMGLCGEARERELRRVEEMQLKVARTWFRPDYSREMMEKFNLWLDEMKRLGVEVAIQSAWWFTKDVWYFAHEKHNDPTYTQSIDNFKACSKKLANWIAKALEYFIVVRNYTHIKYLVLFTEPTSYESGPVPQGLTLLLAYEICCRAIHEKLIEYGLRDKIKLMGPNGVFIKYEDEQLKYAVEKMNDIIDIYSMHTYAWSDSSWMKNPDFIMSDYDGWLKHVKYLKEITAPTGKPLWFDEYGLSAVSEIGEKLRSDPKYGNFIAQANTAFINGGTYGSFIWLLFDQKYFWDTTNNDSFHNGVHRWGTAYMPGDDVPEPFNVRPVWYMLSLISKYMSDGDSVVYETITEGKICACSAGAQNGDFLSLLIVNREEESVTVEIESGVSGLSCYLYDPANIECLPDKYMLESCCTIENSSFKLTLPPLAAIVLTNKNK